MFVRSAGLSDAGDRRANASQNESQQMIPRDLRITIRLFVELGMNWYWKRCRTRHGAGTLFRAAPDGTADEQSLAW